MAVNTVDMRTALATAYAAAAPYATLTSTSPGTSPGVELPVTRQASNWGGAANSSVTSSPAAFAVPSGATVAGVQFMSMASGGAYLDGAAVTPQTFASAGTYTATATYTQS